ncbi:FAD binding domain-containing protein [Sinorhizobium meliloti]|uniref:FAD binding domain-containing protein n=1 Tax=Rhizobium meliloti TaxID=382 RepID=UPI000FDC909C|nr:xanthine dehydrogenase family protein subunit M [Sinorhizobium meliloti]RVH34191.1 xanthine dehydrogenase family protein subunit M [Sinorhizobium meliloti]
MYATTYHKPKTIAEAIELYEGSQEPSYLAGGHTLIPTLKNRLAAPQDLIDLRAIPELSGIEVTSDKVIIGSATRHAAVAASKEVRGAIPTLAGLAGSIGDVQVRHMGTIGGSIANNDPAADYPSAVLSLDAIMHTDRREIPAEDYFQGLYATALEPGEILVRIEFRIPEVASYAKFRNPASRYSMAAAFVSKHRDGHVCVAVTGAGNAGVFRWTEAEERLTKSLMPDALDGLAIDPSFMMNDMHAPADYRAHLVAVMSRRAVQNLGGTYIL